MRPIWTPGRPPKSSCKTHYLWRDALGWCAAHWARTQDFCDLFHPSNFSQSLLVEVSQIHFLIAVNKCFVLVWNFKCEKLKILLSCFKNAPRVLNLVWCQSLLLTPSITTAHFIITTVYFPIPLHPKPSISLVPIFPIPKTYYFLPFSLSHIICSKFPLLLSLNPFTPFSYPFPYHLKKISKSHIPNMSSDCPIF